MVMNDVFSSNISKIGYDSGTLHVIFNNGSYYTYSNVPEGLYIGLMLAASKGSYFARNIKSNYSFTRIR